MIACINPMISNLKVKMELSPFEVAMITTMGPVGAVIGSFVANPM